MPQQSFSGSELPTPITVTTLIFIVCCLLSTVRIVKEAPTPAHLHDDVVARRSDRRFSALKAELPGRGIVGYVGESGNSSAADYYLAQYALAPLVVDNSPNHSLVVGNFPTSPLRATPDDLQLVKDFGNGVLLFANPRFTNAVFHSASDSEDTR